MLPPVSEMVYHVTNLANSGTGSLRDCVALANADGVRSRIVFDVGGTINTDGRAISSNRTEYDDMCNTSPKSWNYNRLRRSIERI